MRPGFIVGGIAGALIIIAVITYWPETSEISATSPPEAVDAASDPTAEAPVEATAPAAIDEEVQQALSGPETAVDQAGVQSAPAPTTPPLPALAASDDWVRNAFLKTPLPEVLSRRDALLARLTVMLVNASAGSVARREVAELVPGENFSVIGIDEETFELDPASFRRYDHYLDQLEAVPPETLATFLRQADPLLVLALAQLGDPRQPELLIRQTLQRIDQLPDLPARVLLVRPRVLYEYADPELEALADFDKQLLRIGPGNLSRLRRYVSEFKSFYFQE